MNDYSFLMTDRWHMEGDNVWFSAAELNGLFNYNKDSCTCRKIMSIQIDRENGFRLHPRVIKKNKKLYLLPDKGNNIVVYHMNNHSVGYINVDNFENQRIALVPLREMESGYYLVSNSLRKIFYLDCNSDKLLVQYDFSNESGEFFGGCFYNSCYYTVASNKSKIIKINLFDKSLTSYTVDEICRSNINTICIFKDYIYMTGDTKEIYKWDEKRLTCKKLISFPESFSAFSTDDVHSSGYIPFLFIKSILIDNCIYFIPYRANKLLKLDCERDMLFELKNDGEDFNVRNCYSSRYLCSFQFIYQYDKYCIGLFDLNNSQVIEYNVKKERIKKLKISYDTSLFDNKKYLFNETICTNLNNFTNYVASI